MNSNADMSPSYAGLNGDAARRCAELEKLILDRDMLMNITGVCIVKISLPGYTLTEYNDALCRLIGYTREEYEQRFNRGMAGNFRAGYRKELDLLRKAAAEALAAGRHSFTLNMRIPTRKGSAWVGGAASFADCLPGEKLPGAMYAVFGDITDIVEAQSRLELAEAELQKAEALEIQNANLRRMIDAVPSGLGALRIVDGVPDAAMQINRYFTDRVDIAVSENGTADLSAFLACLHPDDRESCDRDFREFLKVKSLMDRQYRMLTKDGQYIWGRVRATVVPDDGAEIAYFVYTNINDMKLADNRLQESRRLYERTVDAMQIAMWTYDIPARRIVMGENAATVALRQKFGWPRVFENAPESTVFTVDDGDREKYLAMFRDIEAGNDTSCEVWYQRRAGLEPYCERESYHVVRDDSGRPLLAYGIGQNITAEKKVEERYRREMEYLRRNSDESLIAKGRYDLTLNQVLEYDSSLRQDFYAFLPGSSYDEAYGEMLRSAYGETDRREIADKLDRSNLIRGYQQGQMQASLQYRKSVDGRGPIWVSMTVHAYMMPETGNLELFSYAYDITEGKLIDTVMDLISQEAFDYIGLIFAETGQFEFLRKSPDILFPGLRQRTSYQDCCGYVRTNFVNDDEKAQFSSAVALENILAGLDAGPRHTATYRRTEGSRLLCKQLDYVWLDRAGKVILVTRTDVTAAFERDRIQLEKIEAAKLDAERANEAKSAFLSSMSHDLRTPLSGVLGFTNLALKEPDPQKKQDYLKKIDASGRLLLELVNDTLELSRIESGKASLEPEAVMPDDLIPAVVTALRPSAELKSITLLARFEIDASAPVWCDKLKVQKIALNLISNAIKYTPEGGTVSVTLKDAEPNGSGCNVCLTVEDTGIGMSEEFMKRMYEPFSQEKRSGTVKIPGTGLGLSIVKRYVDLMGGRIAVSSALHRGTRWDVFLPLCQMRGGQPQKQEDASYGRSLSGRRVLLCEDNRTNTEIVVTLMNCRGVLVETAENGRDGLYRFAASAPGYFDAILMDLRMPVMDGYEAARQIRALPRPDAATVPILAMTADAFEESLRESKAAGMDGYTTKPFEPNQLFGALCDAIENRSGRNA